MHFRFTRGIGKGNLSTVFYMCGMNAKDIYELCQSSIAKNRINYNRSKTRKRRKESAFISINLFQKHLHYFISFYKLLTQK
jgi:hypothetical protein